MPDRIRWLSTERVGQLTGSSSTELPTWPNAVDVLGWPLLNDSGRWSVLGTDMGANAEHPDDGRLYIFFGDVAVEKGVKKYSNGEILRSDNPMNADLVAWTDAQHVVRHGGHLAVGWKFIIPNDQQGATAQTGQKDWRFCGKCNTLFWAPDENVAGSFCPFDGGTHNWIGWNFVVPNDQQGATDQTGQKNWRFCSECHALFFAPDQLPAGVCPKGGRHQPLGWNFYLPNDQQGATDATGQKDWRFCLNCHGLFFDGFAHKGVCPAAPGGGFHIHPVLRAGGKDFDPFAATDPIGITESLELPSGAFSHGGRMYVFTNLSEWKYSGVRRIAAGDPVFGQYLVSKERPSEPGPYRTEFLFSPRIGRCPTDHTRQHFESHNLRGYRFVLPHSRPADANRVAGWRYCIKCEMLFRESSSARACWRGGAHEARPGAGFVYALQAGGPESLQNQAGWHECGKCSSLFWNGDHTGNTGLCPAAGNHVPVGASLTIPHLSPFDLDEFHEGSTHQPNWRYCGKCGGLFFGVPAAPGQSPGRCPAGDLHEARGLNFVLHHDGRPPDEVIHEGEHIQKNWCLCAKCRGMFWNGDPHFKGKCPVDGVHNADGSKNFALHHDEASDPFKQMHWRFCGKCAGLFWDGGDFKGVCPADLRSHSPAGINFALPHNLCEDAQNQERWRFCTKCYGMVHDNGRDIFPGASPVIIRNGEHGTDPGFPEPGGTGVALFCRAWEDFRPSGMRLAWMPLRDSAPPRLEDVRYYTGLPGEEAWSPDPTKIANLFDVPNHWTSFSALWLKDVRRWILVYCGAHAHEPQNFAAFQGPVYARISDTPWGLADAEEIQIFNPRREQAYGRYMHFPGLEDIHLRMPPLPDFTGGDPGRPREDLPGWAYGAFLLERFTHFDASSRELSLHYLLSFGRPYQVQVMQTRLRILEESFAHDRLFYGGNGTTPVDSGLPLVGVLYGIARNGNLLWYRYLGSGAQEPSGQTVWHGNSGNPIGNGWQHLEFVLGCGDGVILAVHPNGNLHWYCYQGNGESDVTGSAGWHSNSGNVIGNGWAGLRDLFVFPQAGRPSNHLKLLAVMPNGDLRWYSYHGNGEHDPTGTLGWHPNSGNTVGNGWQGLLHLHGSGNVVFAVRENGDLLWYSYSGQGEHDPTGTAGWHPNSGNAIGNGWNGLRHIFGGTSDAGRFGHVIYAVDQNGALRWYRYEGNGEVDQSGVAGWAPNSGNIIGNDW